MVVSISIHDIIRKRLYEQSGLIKETILNIDNLRISEWSNDFEKLMRNRLLFGAFRYGLINKSVKPKFDRVDYMKTKLQRYQDTGNIETLVDVANLALLEFEEGEHPNRHFESLDNIGEHCGIKYI